METIRVIDDGGIAISPGGRWQPEVGHECLDFLDGLFPDAKERVREETVEILSRGTEPNELRASAGLVVGYVQSGKTTSFTAAAALARDNKFALVIVVAGTSKNLLKQTQDRLRSDLKLDDKAAYRRWIHAKSPRLDTEDASKIAAALEEWVDPAMAGVDKATVLITVMKQHQHLGWLSEVLNEIGSRIDLSKVTALVIDDEADQASPNVSRQAGKESSTYSNIRALRAMLPSHTLLEYTATPQAPLLVSLVDELSPDYVCVIDPGPAYTGGRYFFQEHRQTFVKHIPAEDSHAIDDDTADEPPLSLNHAFATFALGCAAGTLLGCDPPQRSMLVHPSRDTLPHGKFVRWIKNIRDLWAELLSEEDGQPDRASLVADFLEPAYEDLVRTAADLPSLGEMLAVLPKVLKKTAVEAVNATKASSKTIDWSSGYAWVLVGGQLLDRGFTVEGLTVTYMPRGLGLGHADATQQRARFFGYKRSYAGYCRAWLDPAVDQAFHRYVEHEEHMRKQLIGVAESGETLQSWKRQFLLDKRMKPTRAAVVRLGTDRWNFADKWFKQKCFEDRDEAIFALNRDLVSKFCARYSFEHDPGDPRRQPTQIHPFADVDLEDVLRELFTDFVMTDQDSVDFAMLRVLLQSAVDEGGAVPCRVHQMTQLGPGDGKSSKYRSLDERGHPIKLFQGKNEKHGYPGAEKIKAAEAVTVQIYQLDLRDGDAKGETLAVDVPVLAIWVPSDFLSVIAQVG
ncbi:MAG: Z1 domain-containing protein [Fimbriimonadaceae bacterium]|nr:Z1 domain-containing protein [Fimbriimonadaceae bacterium]